MLYLVGLIAMCTTDCTSMIYTVIVDRTSDIRSLIAPIVLFVLLRNSLRMDDITATRLEKRINICVFALNVSSRVDLLLTNVPSMCRLHAPSIARTVHNTSLCSDALFTLATSRGTEKSQPG